MRVYRPAGPVVWTFGFLAVLSACYFGCAVTMLAIRELRTDDEWIARLILMAMLGAMTTVFPYLWIVTLTQKIAVRGLSISFVGVFRKRTIHLRDVTRVLWRKNDSVTLIAGRCRQRYWFGTYRVEDVADLIKLIRNNVPAALHEGWHPFYQARMKGRLDRQQRFLLQNPRAKLNPQPIKVGRLLAISLATSLVAALVIWGRIAWEFRNMAEPPPSNLTGNWLVDCLMIAAFANVPPLLLVFIELFRLRRKRRAWETTGIEFASDVAASGTLQ